MSLKTNEESVPPKAISKKSRKAELINIMEDAPLFAGLDDYIQKQTAKINAEPAKVVQKKERTATRQTKRTASAQSLPQSAPKVKEAPLSEPGAMLLSVTEICALLKISRATLVRMDKSGQLPGRIKLGGSVRFHRETVETWLQSLINTNPTTS